MGELRVGDAKAELRKVFLVQGGEAWARTGQHLRELVAFCPRFLKSLNLHEDVRYCLFVRERPRPKSGMDIDELETALVAFCSNPLVEKILGKDELDQAIDMFIGDEMDSELEALSSTPPLVEKVFGEDDVDQAIDMFLEGLDPSAEISLMSNEETDRLLKEILDG